MVFTETKLKGAYIIMPEKHEDGRGSFARTFCQNEFEAHGLSGRVVQCSMSYNTRKGTFRGMHFQIPPYEEAKTVRCVNGALMDYIVDLREDSETFRQWVSIELSAENGYAVYIPKSFAHGFLTLVDNTVIHYQMSEFYRPSHARGFRYDDPAFNIQLPFPIKCIAQRDLEYEDLFVCD